jgi:hypothetical protein
VANDIGGEFAPESDHVGGDVATGAATGAGTGAVLGGIAGLLVGAGALAIPGIGPIVAAGPLAAALTGAGLGAAAGGLIGALAGWGIPEEEAGLYAEGVRRGGTLVGVTAEGARVQKAADILERNGAVDIERRSAEWRESGWTGYDKDAEPLARDEIARERAARGVKIPVVEERLDVGTRQVERGAVRARTHVEEKPVEADVRLREERVRVDRHPVDRPASDVDVNALREGSIEVTERAEVPVVGKQARVVEEVVLDKDVAERKEKWS